ncbi:MAG: thiamine pyrophosphate-binding protein [Isosphaeraceae bacterium]
MSTEGSRTGGRQRVADRLAGAAAASGVRHVFGMPGSHTTTLYDAFVGQSRLRTVLFRNEQAAAFAADGYARVTGTPGVVCTTAGPGATNALTGVAEAWADTVPVLLLAGQVNADRLHEECGAYHEIDLDGIFAPVTKFRTTVVDPSAIEGAFSHAWAAMTQGRPRPAALILPQDVMAMHWPGSRAEAVEASHPVAPPPDMTAAADVLNRAERPVVLAGGGALWAGAANVLREVARVLDAPVVTSLNGKGIVDERAPESLGHARSVQAREVLPHADAMLAVGCRFTEVMTRWRRMPVPEALVQIDVDPSQLGMNYPAKVGVAADARVALEQLLPLLKGGDRRGWRDQWGKARELRPGRPEWLIETLREVLPDNGVVFTDACELGYRFQTDWVSTGPRRLFYPSNYITLGWGFPAALGAAVALGPGVPVVSVSGDGGFVVTCQELSTAARYGLHVLAVVHNDSTYGAIKNIQEQDQGGRFRDVDLNNPDFVRLAESFGVTACRARDAGAFADAVRAALERGGPTLIEVPDDWRKIRD